MPYQIYTCHFLAWRSALIGYGKDWLAQFQNNVTGWDIRSLFRLPDVQMRQHYKVTMSVHCHKTVPVKKTCKTSRTNQSNLGGCFVFESVMLCCNYAVVSIGNLCCCAGDYVAGDSPRSGFQSRRHSDCKVQLHCTDLCRAAPPQGKPFIHVLLF